MTRPDDRTSTLPELGKVNRAAGEFWAPNPFLLPQTGQNLSAYEQNRLFLNTQGTGFMNASYFSGANLDADSRSVVAADFDGDGRVDLLVGSVGGGPLRLFLNRFRVPGHHRVRIDLTGEASSHSAIGARVELECESLRLTRDLFAANGFMGQSPAELLIGVAQETSIRRLTIRWPSGRIQEFTDLPVDTRISITEGNSNVKVEKLSESALSQP